MHFLQAGDHRLHARRVGIAERLLVPGLGGDRQQRGLGQGLEGTGALMRAPAASVTAASSEAGKGEADDAAGRPRRAQAPAEQLEKHQPLALGNQVDAIQQRIAEPGKQLQQGAAGVAEARVGPFRVWAGMRLSRSSSRSSKLRSSRRGAGWACQASCRAARMARPPALGKRDEPGVVSFQPSSSRTVTASAPGVPERASR